MLTGQPAELLDPGTWPECAGFDGRRQPCSCRFAALQAEFLEGGGEWPGGEAGALADFVRLSVRFECRAPFDPRDV